MTKEKENNSPIVINVGGETFGFKVPGHAEIKFYYDTGADSLYEASRNLILACAADREGIKKVISQKPAVVPQIAVNLLRIAGTGMEVKLENFPSTAADS
ncbi:hypothetical protein GF359_05030 [candidate division WOR-3 bacterium]|uniref:Uncharacterized protein n=1 Tax=candidate division WOR-3 bacterium TaxID=2052148 RepID=A0A9D5QCH5_UNCW3|nr:hypothetical protein [candidate division WOR-3 bacterium]MBD3364559.1 hypothetical protein [candidate division WOR-3 bacterium]